MQEGKVCEIIMENLSYQIKGKKVVWRLIVNTVPYYTVSDLISKEYCVGIIKRSLNQERVLNEINEGNQWLYLEQMIIYSGDNTPLLSFELDKGKKLRPEERIATLEEIKKSIEEQKEYTTFTLFEMSVNDLQYIEYKYSIDGVAINHIYLYQIYWKQYQRV